VGRAFGSVGSMPVGKSLADLLRDLFEKCRALSPPPMSKPFSHLSLRQWCLIHTELFSITSLLSTRSLIENLSFKSVSTVLALLRHVDCIEPTAFVFYSSHQVLDLL